MTLQLHASEQNVQLKCLSQEHAFNAVDQLGPFQTSFQIAIMLVERILLADKSASETI